MPCTTQAARAIPGPCPRVAAAIRLHRFGLALTVTGPDRRPCVSVLPVSELLPNSQP